MFVLHLNSNQYVRHRATTTTMKNFLITGTFPNGKVDDNDTGVYENNCDLRVARLQLLGPCRFYVDFVSSARVRIIYIIFYAYRDAISNSVERRKKY